MGKVNFRELKVWQKSKDLAVFVYRITSAGMFSKDLWVARSDEKGGSIHTEHYCRRK